jgi:hypothetical protein
MSYHPGSTSDRLLVLKNGSGVMVNADSLPVGVMWHNGAIDGVPVITITNKATGLYLVSGTIPLTYQPGDDISIVVTTIISAVTALTVLWMETLISTPVAGGGNTVVNQNTPTLVDGSPTTDNLRLVVMGQGIDGAQVLAFLQSDYLAGNVSAQYVQGETMTGPVNAVSGRWPNPLLLASGNTYVILFSKPGVIDAITATITI